ncbi:MAG: SDR family NAD(P)-dependent oxidoreductase [Nocardioidaceae bacterium]
MTKLDGALALVTGASSGIGRATALELAAAGCRLLLCGRDEARLERVVVDTDGDYVVADLADADDVRRLAERVNAGPLPDLVVHNAGVGLSGPLCTLGDAEIQRVLAVNLLAPIGLTREWLPGMLERGGGHFVFVTSIAGLLGVPQESVYAASKAGLTIFAASLRSEVARFGLTVTTVAPGVVATEFSSRRGEPYTRRFPRPISADRVARALVDAVEHDRAEVVVPGWLKLAVAVQALAPQRYSTLSSRWGHP